MSRTDWVWFLGIAACIPLFLSPNPFGNMTTGLSDEEVFVRTALSALGERTLPGLDFADTFRAPYGALQTHLLFASLAPGYFVLEGALGAEHAARYLSARAGDLIQIMRWLSGASALALMALIASVATRIAPAEHRRFVLIALLLLANPLFMSFIHTGKAWVVQVLCELAVGILVIGREYARAQGQTAAPAWYLPALVILALAAASQTFMGALAGAWIAYAIYLGHIGMRDLAAFVRRYALWILAALLLQASFFVEGYRVSTALSASLTEVTGVPMPYAERLTWPLVMTLQAIPFAVGIVAAGIVAARKRLRQDARVHVALLHPLLIYVSYFILAGFPHSLRYLLPLTSALALSAALLAPAALVSRRALALWGILALSVSIAVTSLWWRPAAERVLVETLLGAAALDAPEATVLIEPESLWFLSAYSAAAEARAMESLASRAAPAADARAYADQWHALSFMRAAQTEGVRVGADVRPIRAGAVPHGIFPPGGRLFLVTADCRQRCTAPEEEAGTCLEINPAQCAAFPGYQDGSLTLFGLVQTEMLGGTYIIRELSTR